MMPRGGEKLDLRGKIYLGGIFHFYVMVSIPKNMEGWEDEGSRCDYKNKRVEQSRGSSS